MLSSLYLVPVVLFSFLCGGFCCWFFLCPGVVPVASPGCPVRSAPVDEPVTTGVMVRVSGGSLFLAPLSVSGAPAVMQPASSVLRIVPAEGAPAAQPPHSAGTAPLAIERDTPEGVAARVTAAELVDDRQALELLLVEVQSGNSERRDFALEQVKQLDAAVAVPRLKAEAEATADARTKVAILDAIAFLELPAEVPSAAAGKPQPRKTLKQGTKGAKR
jgi:hypothetical protein